MELNYYFDKYGKNKFNLKGDILKIELPQYNHGIKPEKVTDSTDLLKLKGSTETGLPKNHEIEELFSIDVRKCNKNEQRVLKRWMGNDFVKFRDYLVRCDGDIDRYIEYILNATDEQLKHYGWIPDEIKKGNLDKVKKKFMKQKNRP